MARSFVDQRAASDRGQRPLNEDQAHALELSGGRAALVVADGMGGYRSGDVASQVATEAFIRSLREGKGDDRAVLREAVQAAAQAVADAASESGHHDMGTTFVAALASRHGLEVANIGDSRAVLVLQDRLEDLSQEHSAVTEARLQGTISEDEARTSPFRHAVSRSLGAEVPEERDVYFRSYFLEQIPSNEGAVVLLGSDGLMNHLGEDEIRAVLTGTPSLREAARGLIQVALANGSTDNVSAALLEIHPWPRQVVAVPAQSPMTTAPSDSHRGLVLGLCAAGLVVATALGLLLLRVSQTPPTSPQADERKTGEIPQPPGPPPPGVPANPQGTAAAAGKQVAEPEPAIPAVGSARGTAKGQSQTPAPEAIPRREPEPPTQSPQAGAEGPEPTAQNPPPVTPTNPAQEKTAAPAKEKQPSRFTAPTPTPDRGEAPPSGSSPAAPKPPPPPSPPPPPAPPVLISNCVRIRGFKAIEFQGALPTIKSAAEAELKSAVVKYLKSQSMQRNSTYLIYFKPNGETSSGFQGPQGNSRKREHSNLASLLKKAFEPARNVEGKTEEVRCEVRVP
jgi:protein phosphatase